MGRRRTGAPIQEAEHLGGPLLADLEPAELVLGCVHEAVSIGGCGARPVHLGQGVRGLTLTGDGGPALWSYTLCASLVGAVGFTVGLPR
ncbi:hypothetical protein GCM10009566_42560 [Streptomyces murinus]